MPSCIRKTFRLLPARKQFPGSNFARLCPVSLSAPASDGTAVASIRSSLGRGHAGTSSLSLTWRPWVGDPALLARVTAVGRWTQLELTTSVLPAHYFCPGSTPRRNAVSTHDLSRQERATGHRQDEAQNYLPRLTGSTSMGSYKTTDQEKPDTS